MEMWIHPAIQTIALLLALWAFRLGYNRFCFQHLNIKCRFDWKLHVKLGKVVHGLWLFGMGVGVYMAWNAWGSVNLTGGHYLVGVSMIPIILVGLGTGLALEKPSGKRAKLALIHGTANTALLLMALYQAWSGVEAIQLFLLD